MDLQANQWATDVLQAILAQQGLCIRCHALQGRLAQCQDWQRQMQLVRLVTIARQGHRRPHQPMMLLKRTEATGADLATIALEALAGQSLAVLGPTILPISLPVLQRAYSAQQGRTVALLDSQRQPISVRLDIFAQLAHRALSHRLVYALLVRHAQLEQ